MSSLPTLSRREAVKREKRRRIIAAARRVFTAEGFERATTQEIARLARIATGTLFLYARDKRELLLMVFNDELESITDASIAAPDASAALLDQLIAFYRPRFEFWVRDVPLARLVTGEVYASRGPAEVGVELARVVARQQRMVSELERKVAAYAHREGAELAAPAATIASGIHYLYVGELRVWLSGPQPDVDTAVANLAGFWTLFLHGIFRSPTKTP